MTFEAPISRWRETVLPEWTDYNGHMNVAYFVLIFDHGTDAFYPLIGLGQPYRDRTGKSTFAVEAHITYGREASVGDEIMVTTQLLGFDEKRIHYFPVMSHAEEGYQMATQEQLALHVDLTKRKVEPIPEESLKLLAEMADAHAALPQPREVGSTIVLGSKKKS
jgi:acyl-CoA thioester hydrolase